MSSGWVKNITGIRRRHVNKEDFWTGFRSISHRLKQILGVDGDGWPFRMYPYMVCAFEKKFVEWYEVQRVIFSGESRPRHLYLRMASSGSCTQSAP
ncbi:uncharacterized protein Dana_GF27524, isoform C [Drosophila ananassae]|uniref:Uncharacterized protein, isoform B n=1 Tax=Drosophila ananassae TaxID=7217 RepID=A0A0P8XDC2_DROAN|nr:uncharacterized protein Dana_GF27524, isoform B [Drosophila ananassae]KPU72650.1 uncharacterized protein Dana_GF27524, isoform C [Drosophila ananassae]